MTDYILPFAVWFNLGVAVGSAVLTILTVRKWTKRFRELHQRDLELLEMRQNILTREAALDHVAKIMLIDAKARGIELPDIVKEQFAHLIEDDKTLH